MPSYTGILGTLDQLSPAIHIVISLCFASSDPDAAVECLERGVHRTVEQLPFLSGKIFPVTEDGRMYAVISWSDNNPQVKLEEATVLDLPTYAELEHKHMPLTLLSHSLRPLESREPQKFPHLGALALSYAKLDGGLILTIAVHHQLTDGGGLEILIDTLARNTRGGRRMYLVDTKEPMRRNETFEAMINQTPTEDSYTSPIPTPTESNLNSPSSDTPFETLLFRFSIQALDQLRNELASHTAEDVSINTAVTALLWYVVSRTQIKRLKETEKNLDVSQISSMLLLSKSMRKLFQSTGFTDEKAWFGNSNMMCMPPAIVPFSWLDAPEKKQGVLPDILPEIADLITRSVTTTSLSLVAGFLKPLIKSSCEPGFDFTSVLKETPLYRPLNFISTSWAVFEFYQDFGPNLGRPQFVRPLAAALDGVSGAVVIPRKRDDCWTEGEKNTLEVLVGLDKRDVKKIVHSEWLRPLLLSAPE